MSDLITTQVFVDGEVGITATKMNNIVGLSTIQPAFYSSKAASSTLDPTDLLLELKNTGSYATITGSQLINSISSSISGNLTPQITAVRLRSFNAIQNPAFEVDQRNVGNGLVNPANGVFVQDRWVYSKGGSTTFAVNSNLATSAAATSIFVPGTTFAISRAYQRITLTTQQASLGASDYLRLFQTVEGPQLRELLWDVHSISLIVRSSVAGLKFAVMVRDSPVTQSLGVLCTIPTANTFTLIQLPNLPVFPAGNFSVLPGVPGYTLEIVLACGTTLTGAANTWQSGNFLGVPGMSNFAASPVNSTFDIGFVQHEPGALCTTPIDCPFQRAYDDALRYYQKTYSYAVAPGAVTGVGQAQLVQPNLATGNVLWPFRFVKVMAKAPTIVGYSPTTGTASAVRDVTGTTDRGISAYLGVGDSGFSGFQLASNTAANAQVQVHYTADTGW